MKIPCKIWTIPYQSWIGFFVKAKLDSQQNLNKIPCKRWTRFPAKAEQDSL